MSRDLGAGTVSRDLGAEWMSHMRRGDFAAAWRVSDAVLARRKPPAPDVPRHLQQIWDGSGFAGRRVLIRCYHGLGDTIQFIRFAPAVRALAREVIVWAQPDLIPLLRSAAGIDRLQPLHDGAPDFDFDVDVEVMELAYALRVTADQLPGPIPYLHVDGGSPRTSAFTVGIVASVGAWDKAREVPLSLFAGLAERPDVDVQVIRPAEPIPRHMRVAPDTDTIPGTARLLKSLDLLVSVDSMPAHLAGALGVPVWTLLRHHADWRWMEDRHDTPWYPTMRLFRQEREGDWTGVVDRVRHEIGAMQSSPSPERIHG